MLISKLKLAGACALGLVLTMGGMSGYALQQGPAEKKEEPTPVIETPQDNLKPRVASEMRELRAAIDESELELAELKSEREKLEKRIAVAESVVARHRKMLSNLFQNAIKPQTAPAQKPAEEQKANGAKQPEYLDPDQPIVVPSESGHVVTVFGVLGQRGMGMGMGGMMARGGGMGAMGSMMGGGMGGANAYAYAEPLSVRLAEEGAPGLEVVPVTNQLQLLIPLVLRGEKIQRLAVFNKQYSRWDVQELREPVKEAIPVSGSQMTAYALGRRLYTYSVPAGRWSVLELPEGARPKGVANDRGLRLKYGDKIHLYNIQSGEWTEFDLRVTPKESKKEE